MTTIKKASALILTLLLMAGSTFAQKNKKDSEETTDPDKYKKLKEYYDGGKYADCIWKAEKWMDNEKYMKDAELYLYPSMSYLGIYKDPDSYPLKKFPDLKNPLKDAMSYFVKFKKHDKKGEMLEQNREYVDELRNAVIEQALDYREKKETSRLTTLSRDILKSFDKDEVMMLLGGSYMLMTNNLADGMKATDTAMATLKRKLDEKPNYTSNEQKALTDGFIVYTDYLIKKADKTKAKDAMLLATALLASNDKLKQQAEKIESNAPAK